MRVTVEPWVLVELVKLAAKAARCQDDLLPIDAAQRALALITSESVI